MFILFSRLQILIPCPRYIPYVDNFAHLGGFLMGLLVGMVFYPVVSETKRHKSIVWGFRIAAIPLIIVLFVVLISGRSGSFCCNFLGALAGNKPTNRTSAWPPIAQGVVSALHRHRSGVITWRIEGGISPNVPYNEIAMCWQVGCSPRFHRERTSKRDVCMVVSRVLRCIVV